MLSENTAFFFFDERQLYVIIKWQSATLKIVMTAQKIMKTIVTQKKNMREQSRMNFRLAPEIKQRVARAAALTGQDLTEFAVTALSEKADQIIERHDQMLLGSEDYEFFLNALEEKTAKPSEKLRESAENYRRGTRKGVRYELVD